MTQLRLGTLFLILGLFIGYTPAPLYATDEPTPPPQHHDNITQQHEDPNHFEVSEVIFDHIQDAHEFHFFTYKHIHGTIPLPIIIYSPQRGWSCFMSSAFHHGHAAHNGYMLQKQKIVAVDDAGNLAPDVQVYDFSMTRNVVQMLIALTLLVWIVFKIKGMYVKQQSRQTTQGIQSFMEPVILFVQNEVAYPNLGKQKGAKYVPYLLTVFFFILINNLFGLIPGSANVTGNIAFTITLAFISLLVILFSTNKHFWGHIFWPPGPLFVKVILIPIEFIGIFTKPFALLVRLFANMVAGHIIIICFISLIFIFSKMSLAGGIGFSPVSIAFTVFIYVIEVLVAFIQAFIFTNLTAVFIGQAMEGSHDEAHHH